LSAQPTDTTYLNANWEITKDKAEAQYFRIIEKVDRRQVLVKDYYISGQIQMKGTYSNKNMNYRNGYFTFYFENGNIDTEGPYSNNSRAGLWKYYREDGTLCAKVVYKKDNRKSALFYDAAGNKIPKEEAERVAEFPGGDNSFTQFVNSKLKINNLSKKKGMVKMELTLDKHGAIKVVNLLYSSHDDLTNEIFRIIKLMPNFIPARIHNRNEASVLSTNFEFKQTKKKLVLKIDRA